MSLENDCGSEPEIVVVPYKGRVVVPPPATLTKEEEKKLWRKIDLKILPILTLLYLFSFLDRGEHHPALPVLIATEKIPVLLREHRYGRLHALVDSRW
jgi:hypothetical protein